MQVVDLHCKPLLDELRVIFPFCDDFFLSCGNLPVLEGIVNDGFQYQSVTNVRRATKMEHVYGPQGGVCITQATISKYREKRQRCLAS